MSIKKRKFETNAKKNATGKGWHQLPQKQQALAGGRRKQQARPATERDPFKASNSFRHVLHVLETRSVSVL